MKVYFDFDFKCFLIVVAWWCLSHHMDKTCVLSVYEVFCKSHTVSYLLSFNNHFLVVSFSIKIIFTHALFPNKRMRTEKQSF